MPLPNDLRPLAERVLRLVTSTESDPDPSVAYCGVDRGAGVIVVAVPLVAVRPR